MGTQVRRTRSGLWRRSCSPTLVGFAISPFENIFPVKLWGYQSPIPVVRLCSIAMYLSSLVCATANVQTLRAHFFRRHNVWHCSCPPLDIFVRQASAFARTRKQLATHDSAYFPHWDERCCKNHTRSWPLSSWTGQWSVSFWKKIMAILERVKWYLLNAL